MFDPDALDLAQAAQGEEAAFTRLVDRHLERLHRLAWRSLGNAADAEDVAQDAMLRAFRQLPLWQPGQARFSSWLYRVTLNLCQDRLRQRREHLPIEEMELVDPAPEPELALETRQRQHRLEDALAELPQRQREALLLCHYEGLSCADAAQAMETTVEAIESLLARARRQLRQRLGEA